VTRGGGAQKCGEGGLCCVHSSGRRKNGGGLLRGRKRGGEWGGGEGGEGGLIRNWGGITKYGQVGEEQVGRSEKGGRKEREGPGQAGNLG